MYAHRWNEIDNAILSAEVKHFFTLNSLIDGSLTSSTKKIQY
ncbi:hypothetical protein VFMJ11_A0454 [Aliivibrio fischeri MJ11]|uniref:Uncharacterized protein n=1 Tax=Aliivibrio fischeri (strain MJ11) TaxID=388396 RepID=B5ETJ1_ALIFM|nr:hypothetical protein VFMJ11_A0454 [Aliivibrio fischeri MJ11]